MSSGGIWFALLTDTPPFMQACWRLLLTAFLQFFGLVYELKTDKALDAAFWARYKASLPLLCIIGLSLSFHFGAWGWSVAHTSLLDSLLLVCTTPLLLVALMTLRFAFRSVQGRMAPPIEASTHEPSSVVVVVTPQADRHIEMDDGAMALEYHPLHKEQPSAPTLFQLICCPVRPLPPTAMEAIGAILGFLGVVVLLVASSGSADTGPKVTLAGNAAALLGAAAVLVYFEGGATCREWMPLFVYAFPVTFVATLCLAVVSLAFESGTSFTGLGPTALFGFLGSSDRFGLAFGSAAVSGIAGHTFANLAVKYVSPLLISVAILWEPVLGSVVGWLVGVQGAPGTSALAATPLLMIGALLVTVGSRDSGIDLLGWLKAKTTALCGRRQDS
ncbi:hypothetical protein SDRG_04548 [Saprolegnia diclina VS20]|uniref:EamA domain-containing protein n=1 Tax=Saprolegnia diclina (strain VS20) TaxID=1156394 RepID=T0RZX6_SAPDV|nr:hypothetical protein SDRG_04548 [Saprolegnia diclina VS20]EQC38118.1 hypothetical protein SDRG_04548 [Saprolegnia diclina VS20]|eukprot:XP_008608445.1 hypothetical protein SDRG_04548 [Saprolegnia diclina VS20]